MSKSDESNQKPAVESIQPPTLPTLIDAPLNIDMASNVGALLFDSSLSTIMGKAAILDAFLSILTRDCNFNEFIHEILISIIRVVKSEAGSLFELDPVNQIFFFRAVVGTASDLLTNFTIPVGQGVVGHVGESKSPIIIDNAPENREYLKSIEKTVGFETKNMVAFPILIRGRIYGVLELLNRIGEKNYTPEDISLLNYICQMASKAIEIRLMIAWSQKATSEKKAA